MVFTVTYRAKDGALREERVDAANRAECVAVCRKRGISPTKIAEGKPGKSGKTGKAGRPRKLWFAIGAALVIAAGGAWWWLAGRDGKPKAASEQQRVAKPAKKPASRPRHTPPRKSVSEAPAGVASNAVTGVDTNVPPGVDMHRGKRVVSRTVETNKFRLVEWIVTDDGTRYKVMKDPPGAFKTGADQILAIALANMKDGRTAMMPGLSEKELQRAFKDATAQTVEILDSDSEGVKELKRAVIEARKEMAAVVANGGSVTKALEEHLRLKGENAEVRRKCLAEYRKLLQEGKEAEAAEFLNTVNGQLQQLGIDELPASGRDRERPADKTPPGNVRQ